ncbi:hypothetical protein AAHA92_32832 [Salvia divinorum]|uniref:Uncharacterized protein n=1 Tax=Salvia divinorum TaxID=28513 RepID=A0ABD1FLZ7_SALDI
MTFSSKRVDDESLVPSVIVGDRLPDPLELRVQVAQSSVVQACGSELRIRWMTLTKLKINQITYLKLNVVSVLIGDIDET